MLPNAAETLARGPGSHWTRCSLHSRHDEPMNMHASALFCSSVQPFTRNQSNLRQQKHLHPSSPTLPTLSSLPQASLNKTVRVTHHPPRTMHCCCCCCCSPTSSSCCHCRLCLCCLLWLRQVHPAPVVLDQLHQRITGLHTHSKAQHATQHSARAIQSVVLPTPTATQAG